MSRAFLSRFESIRFDSSCESIRIDSFCKKKSAFRFTSCHAVFLTYLLYSLSQKNTPQCTQLKAILCKTSTKKQLRNAHYLLLTYYLNISVQATKFSDCRIESNRKNQFGGENRIESNRKFFLPELECSSDDWSDCCRFQTVFYCS